MSLDLPKPLTTKGRIIPTKRNPIPNSTLTPDNRNTLTSTKSRTTNPSITEDTP
ncbi:hypothetical protein BDV23DRAFT_152787 [Aspergillus alliaceus]|uniref:Uncharacterized protein n=1 Tax=Petromyces alliaceus TaxID=209559 RepID=A0A5N7CCL3_PETAA|nr:hypothetical protein BDV23DRAFT_152787 [Aspergillus alliaceus]